MVAVENELSEHKRHGAWGPAIVFVQRKSRSIVDSFFLLGYAAKYKVIKLGAWEPGLPVCPWTWKIRESALSNDSYSMVSPSLKAA